MDLSGYKFRSEIFKRQLAEEIEKAVAEETAKAKARAVLTVLAARKLAVSDTLHTKILTCTDLTTLERWIHRAVTVASSEDIVHESA